MTKTWLLRLAAFALLAHLSYVAITNRPNTLYVIAHVLNVAAVAAVSVRYSHPKWRSHAMVAALCLAAGAFVFAHQSEAQYGAQP